MTFRSALLLPLLFTSMAATANAADTNNFTLVHRNGRTMGKASFTISKVKDGFLVKSRFEYRTGLAAATPLDSADPTRPGDSGAGAIVTENQYTGEYTVSEDGDFLKGFTQNSAAQTITSFQVGKPRTSVSIGQMQGGVNLGSRTVDMPKPDYLVVPDFDPGALQIFLSTAAAHPHADSTYLFLVPASGTKGGNTAAFVTLQPAPDATGTFDGKPVTLRHLLMNYNKGKADLYTDDKGTLMQADMGPQAASYIRVKFTLDAPK